MLTATRTTLPAIAIALALGAGPAAACEEYNAVVAAVQAQDRSEATRLYEVILADPACDAAIRDWTAVFLAREHFRDSLAPDATPEARRTSLEASLELETHWRTFAALGEIELAEGQYAAAADRFGQALRAIAEGDQTHEATLDDITRVRGLYTDALALSEELVASADPEGELFRTQYRGFTVEETPLPITFEFDSTEFDEQGQVFVQALLDHVLTHNPARIELDGHTDPQGGEDYNLGLSRARADAVRRFLIEGGYTGEVITRGFGESMIPEPPDGVTAGSDEHYRIARRVIFRSS